MPQFREGTSISIAWVLRAGLWDCLSGLHKWPHGFDKDQDWLPQAAQVIRGGMAEHARIARSQGIPPEEHIRRIVTNAGRVHSLL